MYKLYNKYGFQIKLSYVRRLWKQQFLFTFKKYFVLYTLNNTTNHNSSIDKYL